MLGVMIVVFICAVCLLYLKKPSTDEDPNFILILVTVISVGGVLILSAHVFFRNVLLTNPNGPETFIVSWSIFNYATAFPCFFVDSMSNLKEYIWNILKKIKNMLKLPSPRVDVIELNDF